MTTKTYSELVKLGSFLARYEYLRLGSSVGAATFGFDRHLNQRFYTSRQWRDIRNFVIARDLGLDLASDGHEIFDKVIIHHMNPMAAKDIVGASASILDPEFLITTSHSTHNAIHYGDSRLLPQDMVVRAEGDTRLW